MAHFRSQILKGYYKTPSHLLPLISNYVRCSSNDGIRILDPCAGEGEAIEYMGNALGLSSHQVYANELDERRAQVCEQRGLISVCGDAVFELDAPQGGFQLLYLNPPYDYEGNGDGRTERKFLATTRFLQKGGILIYIVPLQTLLIKNIAERLVRGFHNIGVMRFPDDDFAAFHQVVLIACHGRGDPKLESERLLALLDQPPVLGTVAGEPWLLPISSSHQQSFPFFSSHLTPRQITDLLAGPVARSECQIGLVRQLSRPCRTLMPLRAGHQALTLATGLMDGVFLDPPTGNVWVVSGKTEIRESVKKEVDDLGQITIRKRMTPQAVITVFDVTVSSQERQIVLYSMR